MTLERFRNVVAGRPCESTTGRWLVTTNPFGGRDWAEVPRCGPEDCEAAIAAAHAAFVKGPWPALSATARGKLLRRLGDLIARDAEKLAILETRDNGKLFAEMAGQLRYIPEWFYYYGGPADVAFASVNDMAALSGHPHLRRISVETPAGPAALRPRGLLRLLPGERPDTC